MQWYLAHDGAVIDVVDVDPTGRFRPDITFGPLPTGAKVGDPVVAGAVVVPPPTPAPVAARVVSSAAFLALFTPAQLAAAWSADPMLMAGAMKVITQGSANLDSPELAGLLDLAVQKSVLTAADKGRILAGTPPPASAAP